MTAQLEHVNVTVKDAEATAALLCDLFGWHIRWRGDSIHDGTSIHVGGADSYVALYQPQEQTDAVGQSYFVTKGLNHIGVVVDDLEGTEKRVIAAGLKPHSHADYEPGKRFYFAEATGLEIEVVCYQ